MRENWCDLVYEESEKGEAYCGPTVLYTSPQGLNALSAELQRLANTNQLGCSKLAIEEMDHEFSLLFTHIELANQPRPEPEKAKTMKSYLWVGGVLVALPLLALYGVIRLVMDIFG